jgi:hypothetical protein
MPELGYIQFLCHVATNYVTLWFKDVMKHKAGLYTLWSFRLPDVVKHFGKLETKYHDW